MTKKGLNQNGIYVQELINSIEPNFIFSNKPINRFRINENIEKNINKDKYEHLINLKKKNI